MRQGQFLGCFNNSRDGRIAVLDMHLGKTGRVPQFVDKVAIPFNTVLIHFDLPPLGGKGSEGKTKSIGAVLLDSINWINDIAGRL